MAGKMFSSELADKIQSLNAGDYAMSSLLFCVTASRFPTFASHERRLLSLTAASAHLDEAARLRLSDAGFFLRDDGAAVCFHCGVTAVTRVSPDNCADPLRLHETRGQSCELLRLLKFAHGMLSYRDDQVMESAAKLRRALAKLRSDLQQKSHMINLVESFGFSRSSILYCACRMFMTQGGCLPCQPGDMIQQIEECETLLSDCGQVIDVESALKECARLEQERASVVQSAASPQQQILAAENKPRAAALTHQISVEEETEDPATAATADSEKCIQCNVQVRDRVTLPCAHFLLCHSCLSCRRDCPKCGRQILSAIRAFIA